MADRTTLYEAADLLGQLGQRDLQAAVLAAVNPHPRHLELLAVHHGDGTDVSIWVDGVALRAVNDIRVEQHHVGVAVGCLWQDWLEARADQISAASTAVGDVIYALTISAAAPLVGMPESAEQRRAALDVVLAERVKGRRDGAA